MSYNSIPWLPLAAGLTAIGLILSYFAWRRRGTRAALRGVAWSLLPIAAYLTGSIEMFWKIGVAIGDFASAFVFSPVKWVGIGVAGLAAALFLMTCGRERRKAARLARKAAKDGQQGVTGPAATRAGLPAGGATASLPAVRTAAPEPAKTTARPKTKAKAAAPVDDDLKDIEEILRNRGI
jgi:hypothetical protein